MSVGTPVPKTKMLGRLSGQKKDETLTHTISFTAHAVFAATDVVPAFLFVPAVYHVVAGRRSGEESVLMKLAKHRTERGALGEVCLREACLNAHSIQRSLVPS